MSDNDDNNEEEESEQRNKKRSKARIIRSVCFNKEVDSEKHYRELIMLFTSWRDEITDLLGNCASYQEHYFSLGPVYEFVCISFRTDNLNCFWAS